MLQNPITLNVEETSDSTANANISGTIFTYPEPNTELRYKNKRTRNACLVLHIETESNDTIELADVNSISIFDFDGDTGLLVFEITSVPFRGKILVKSNDAVKYTWNMIPGIQTLNGFFMSDDETFGG